MNINGKLNVFNIKNYALHNNMINKTKLKNFRLIGGFLKGSAIFGGTDDWLDLDDSEDWNVASAAFTVEIKIKRGNTSTGQNILGQINSTGTISTGSICMDFLADDTLRGYICGGSTPYVLSATTIITDIATMHDAAFVRDVNTLRIFIDGIQCGTLDVTGVTVNNSAYKFAIGRFGEYTGTYFNGNIAGIRLTKGEALYTGNYSPPSSFTVGANTKLCMNFAEALGATIFIDDTGKTVTTHGDVVIVE